MGKEIKKFSKNLIFLTTDDTDCTEKYSHKFWFSMSDLGVHRQHAEEN